MACIPEAVWVLIRRASKTEGIMFARLKITTDVNIPLLLAALGILILVSIGYVTLRAQIMDGRQTRLLRTHGAGAEPDTRDQRAAVWRDNTHLEAAGPKLRQPKDRGRVQRQFRGAKKHLERNHREVARHHRAKSRGVRMHHHGGPGDRHRQQHAIAPRVNFEPHLQKVRLHRAQERKDRVVREPSRRGSLRERSARR